MNFPAVPNMKESTGTPDCTNPASHRSRWTWVEVYTSKCSDRQTGLLPESLLSAGSAPLVVRAAKEARRSCSWWGSKLVVGLLQSMGLSKEVVKAQRPVVEEPAARRIVVVVEEHCYYFQWVVTAMLLSSDAPVAPRAGVLKRRAKAVRLSR